MLSTELRRAREAKALTQEQLAEALGVHRMTVSRAETGASTPSGETLIAWSTVCGVPLADLMRADTAADVDADEGDASPESAEVMSVGHEGTVHGAMSAGETR